MARLHFRTYPATVAMGAVIFALAGAAFLAGRGSQALASHVGCGDTITADTRLDSDLLNCPNNGIVIGADNIKLDLNGHTIDGDGERFRPCPENEPCDVGVPNDSHDGITIKGGKVTDFEIGVFVFSAKRNRLFDLSAVANAFEGILIVRSTRSRVQRSTASRNGVGASRPGIALIESHDNRIAHNTLSRNGDLALILYASDRNHMAYNTARGNPEDGMIIEGDRNLIVGNRMVRNGGGVLITIVSDRRRAVGNVVRRNYVRAARSGGIAVDRVPSRTLIIGNRVVGSGNDGINVLSRSTTLARNRAFRNADLGIEAVRGVTDGGGNRASGNGDPRQCVNVRCH